MPLGDLTPTVEHGLVQSKALEMRDLMPNCTLSDQAIQLIALRVNTGASTAKLARAVGMKEHSAYIMLGKPQARELMSHLAQTLLGEAAITAVHTMTKIMKGNDPALAYRASESMMERAGLGLSQRTTPDGATKTVFQFAFGAPQAVSHAPVPVAAVREEAQMGPDAAARPEEGPLKTAASGQGEAPAPVILQPGEDSGRTPVILQPAEDTARPFKLKPAR